MSQTKQTVIVNGKVFDVRTGKPIGQSAHTNTPQVPQRTHLASTSPKTSPSQRIISDFAPQSARKTPTQPTTRTAAPHRVVKPQKSTTLRRDVLKKPPQPAKVAHPRKRRRFSHSPLISRFGPAVQTDNNPVEHKVIDQELIRQ